MSLVGLPVSRRIALAAERAGLTAGINGDHAPVSAPRRIVVLGANVIPQPAWLRTLLAMPLEPETLYVDGGAVAVIDTDNPARVLDVAARCRGADELAHALAPDVAVVRHPLEPSGRFALGGPADVAAAETWLLRSLIKPSEGFMSRHVERRISLAVTQRLAPTRITPNVMTIVSVGIGLLGATFFLSPSAIYQVIGALLFLAHSVLDGCDGELARLKFLESRTGAVLDFWGDNFVHVAVFGCMAIGWSVATGSPWPLLLGAVTILSALVTAMLTAQRFIGDGGDAAASWPARLTDALSHRDFIYVVVALAVFGKAHWFLGLTAIGTPSFLLLLVLAGGGRRAARRP